MADESRPETDVPSTPSQKGLHEWAERVAVPNFDFIADPIEAVMDGLTHRAHHETGHVEAPPDVPESARPADRPR